MVEVAIATSVTQNFAQDSIPDSLVPSASMSTAEKLAMRKAMVAQSRAERNLGGRSSRSSVVDGSKPPADSPGVSSQSRLRLSYSEQRVLKCGIRKLHSVVALREDAPPLLQFATRPNGSSLLLPESKSYFERLLSNQVQLQSSTPSDVCNSQRDLRHLSLEQLLVLRVGTLDFATMSQSHTAHTNWNEMVDGHLFKRVARHVLKASYSGSMPQDCVLYRFGFQLVLILGAFEMLQAEQTEASKSVPLQWAVPLDAQEFVGYGLTLFHVVELQLSLLVGDSPKEVMDASRNDTVAVVWDRSTGLGKDRSLSWEVACLDTPFEDIIAEITRANRGKVTNGRSVTEELKSAVGNRRVPLKCSSKAAEHFSISDDVGDASFVDAEGALEGAPISRANSPRMPSLPSSSFSSFSSMASSFSVAPRSDVTTISQQSRPMSQVQIGPMPSLPPPINDSAPFRRVTFNYEDEFMVDLTEQEESDCEEEFMVDLTGRVPIQYRVRKSMVEPLPPPRLEHFPEEVHQRRWTTMIN